MSKILIGLITHPKSTANPDRYTESIEYLSLGFQGDEWKVTSITSLDNAYNRETKLIDIWISKWTNIGLVQNWIQFIDESYNQETKKFWIREVLDFLKRIRAMLFFTFRIVTDIQFKKSEVLKYKRNLNISLSNLKIMHISKDSLFNLTIILEDDAVVKKDEIIREDLINFAKNNLAKSNIPSIVSISESLPISKLFVTDSEGILPIFSFSENIYLPKIMHHNTTCAVIYNQKYVENFISVWDPFIRKLIYRGVPFDWLINALVLSQPANSLFTFHSKQNLIVQGSLHKNES